jgi:phytoene desaturase
MKAIIIGSGLSGLMSAALLSCEGVQVTVYEQNNEIGGVTALIQKNGYSWEQGPLLLGGFLPGEPAFEALKKLGINVDFIRADRGIVMPDYEMWKPDQYAGPLWRKERLKELFPDEVWGINQYYRFYDAMVSLSMLGREEDSIPKKLKMAFQWLKVKKFAHMSAQELMEYFFKSEKIRTLFTGIVADFCASPREFQGLAIPFVNIETAFDVRIPLFERGKKMRDGFCYIRGSVAELVRQLTKCIRDHGGIIHTGMAVSKILIHEKQVQAVRLATGETDQADLVIASGGGKDVFYDLVGKEYLDPPYQQILETFKPMESVFMVHLGIDIDPLQYQKSALCYYYGTYDIEGSIQKMREGEYHEGNDGFLMYVPSHHNPELAPAGHHCLTIYTVAPDTLKTGDWEQEKTVYAEKLIRLAERYIPNLSQHIQEEVIRTPLDYRKLAYLKKSSFGGIVPVMGVKNPPHVTMIEGLYFVGQQSENGGGMSAVIVGAQSTFDQIKKKYSIKQKGVSDGKL